jgi:hypothetical protein
MVKKILLVIGGVALFVVGLFLGGGLLNRRRVGGTGQHLDDVGDSLDRAGDAIDESTSAIDDSARIVGDISAGNSIGQTLIERGREILAAAKARNRDSGG